MADSLTAGRLRLDVVSTDDLQEVHAIFSDPQTHTVGDGPVSGIDETREWIERRALRRRELGVTWYAVRTPEGRLVGTAGLFVGRARPHPELGFEVRHGDQGRGYGRAAATAVVQEGHRAGFGEVWATVRAWNAASLRALAVVGFVTQWEESDERGALVFLRHVVGGSPTGAPGLSPAG
ncbi:hypothetical protein GCM10027519_21670 [Kineococcus endophyticus]